MKNKEVKTKIEELYPFKETTDDDSKYINTLMSIRRVAFLEGADFVMKIINPIL